MKIAVVAANGQAGQMIVAEALKRGHEVTAVVRGVNKTQASHVLSKDLFALTKENLAGFDAVVTAFGAFAPELLPQHETSLVHLAELLADTETRLLVVGGAGSLYMDESLTTQLADTPDFPAEYRPLAQAMAAGLKKLRSYTNLRWTYLSPAADFVADGESKGSYLLAGEVFTLNKQGQSQISYADYALAMLDEIEKGTHIQERISVLGD